MRFAAVLWGGNITCGCSACNIFRQSGTTEPTTKKLMFGLEWKSLTLWPFFYLPRILDFRVRVFHFCLLLLFRFIDDSIVRNILVSIFLVHYRISRRGSCCLLLLLLRRWLLKPVGSVCWWRSCISITTIDFSMNTIFNIILPMSKGKSSDYNKD